LPTELSHSKLGFPKQRSCRRKTKSEEQQVQRRTDHRHSEAERSGAKTGDLCRQHGISTATFYGWRSKYGGLEISEAKRLKQLEEENAKLKRIVADQALDITILKDLAEKMVSPEAKRAAVAQMKQFFTVSERRACGLIDQPRSTQRYQKKRKPEDGLEKRVSELAAARPRFGYRRLTALLKREGVSVWHGRVHRITKALQLQVPHRKRKRLLHSKPLQSEITCSNQHWGMDFVSDSLADGRSFRALAIVDHFTRECPVIEVDLSLPGARVVRVLEQLAEERGLPEAIRVDHGSEFVCDAVRTWCQKKKVRLDYSEPGKPMQNPYASYCTSLERSDMTVGGGRRRQSFVPCAFLGISGPAGSKSCSGLSV
jgi:putative transposase